MRKYVVAAVGSVLTLGVLGQLGSGAGFEVGGGGPSTLTITKTVVDPDGVGVAPTEWEFLVEIVGSDIGAGNVPDAYCAIVTGSPSTSETVTIPAEGGTATLSVALRPVSLGPYSCDVRVTEMPVAGWDQSPLSVDATFSLGVNATADFTNTATAPTTTTTTTTTTTVAPTTAAPTTVAPTTVAPTTVAPTTVAPTTVAPTTVAPTTVAPTLAAPTPAAPAADAATASAGTLPSTGPRQLGLTLTLGFAVLALGVVTLLLARRRGSDIA